MKKVINLIIKKKFNIIATLYINFKFLPFSKAILLPIFMFGRWNFHLSKGQIRIDAPIKKGMIYMGVNIAGYVVTYKSTLKIRNGAELLFKGNAYISQGVQIFINTNATLEINNDVRIGDSVKIICYKHILIGLLH